jgi:hypothetical protein
LFTEECRRGFGIVEIMGSKWGSIDLYSTNRVDALKGGIDEENDVVACF